jgi:protoporphyrinogen oxidase
MSKKRIVILGAGLAGLSAAWHLQRRGIDCQIFEKESAPGGLCRSKNIQGFTFDYDGHLLHFKHAYTFNLVRNLLGDSLAEHKRNAFVYFHDAFIRYPFQANLHGLPHAVIKECLSGFIRALKNGKPGNKNNANFLDWINHNLGKGIARHFMVPYNAKFWTVPPDKLTCEWLDGFIPVPSLGQMIEGTIEESHSQLGYNARFWYPKQGGISRLSLALMNSVRNVHTNCRVKEIDMNTKTVELNSGKREKFDWLISTIPLPEIPHLIKNIPGQAAPLFKKLKWNSVFNLNLGIDKKDFSGRHWVYFPQKEIVFFRIGFPHNFSERVAPQEKSSLYAEVAYSDRRPLDKKNIVARIKRDLQKIRILEKRDKIVAQDINDIKYAYPIYDGEYTEARGRILEFLFKNNIIGCGRYGSWRYMSMECVLLDGKRAAELVSEKQA